MRLQYGVEATAQVLELSFMFATQSEVDGCTHLTNEAIPKSFRLPVIDHKDMELVPVVLQLELVTV